MSIYFVRHGETDWNVAHRWQGSADIPLNKNGIHQAMIARDKLANVRMDRIYCSPLQRAKKTAEIINENWKLPITVDERLAERCFGVHEGVCDEHIDFQKIWSCSDEIIWEGSESANRFYRRVESFLDELIKLAEDQNILLVAHGGVSIPFYCHFHGYDFEDLHSVMIGNCEIRIAEHGEAKRIL